jgi:hypothetical protein
MRGISRPGIPTHVAAELASDGHQSAFAASGRAFPED